MSAPTDTAAHQQPKPQYDEQYEQGLQKRRQVMGDAFVDQAFANADSFTLPLQDFITRQAWGTTWCREGLEPKQRSLITVAMLTALGRSHELKGHVRGAINNGASVTEIQEVLLHASIYCGMPAAVEAFRAAQEVLSGLGLISRTPDGLVSPVGAAPGRAD